MPLEPPPMKPPRLAVRQVLGASRKERPCKRNSWSRLARMQPASATMTPLTGSSCRKRLRPIKSITTPPQRGTHWP